MRNLGINRRYRRSPAFAGILQVDEVQQAVFEAHAAYEHSERGDERCSDPTISTSGNKWKRVKNYAFDHLVDLGQRKRVLRRFEQLSEFDLQALVFAQDDIGPYFR